MKAHLTSAPNTAVIYAVERISCISCTRDLQPNLANIIHIAYTQEEAFEFVKKWNENNDRIDNRVRVLSITLALSEMVNLTPSIKTAIREDTIYHTIGISYTHECNETTYTFPIAVVNTQAQAELLYEQTCNVIACLVNARQGKEDTNEQF